MHIITNYCGYEAGVRNLKKAMDRVFRKIVAKLEGQSKEEALLIADTSYQVNT